MQNGKTVYLALCHGLWDTNTAGIRWLFELTRDERTFVTEDLAKPSATDAGRL